MLRTYLTVFALVFTVPAGARAEAVQMAPLDPRTAGAAAASAEAAHRLFPRLPPVRMTTAIGAVCGGDADTSNLVRYCTDDNVVYLATGLADRMPGAAIGYLVAHQMGHAVQVRHGIADDALSLIRSDPGREASLRAMVTRQVECIAGVIHAAAGYEGGTLSTWFGAEPFTDRHWGRTPLSLGPMVRLGLQVRQEAFERGRTARDVSVCAAGDLGAEALVRALR